MARKNDTIVIDDTRSFAQGQLDLSYGYNHMGDDRHFLLQTTDSGYDTHELVILVIDRAQACKLAKFILKALEE
jgi:hypothetical protein